MSDERLANKVHFTLRDPEVKVGAVNKGERGETFTVICETSRPFLPDKVMHNGAALEFTKEAAHALYRKLGRALGIGIHAAGLSLLLSIPASAQECGMNIRQIADWSPCGQTITPADSIYAQAFGLTADVLRMVDTYVSGGTVNLQAAVFQVDVWMPSECSVGYRLTTKVRTCP